MLWRRARWQLRASHPRDDDAKAHLATWMHAPRIRQENKLRSSVYVIRLRHNTVQPKEDIMAVKKAKKPKKPAKKGAKKTAKRGKKK
jgi:hypothetical protein